MTNSNAKVCKHCNEIKLLIDYHENKEMRDGRSSYCKPCASYRAKVWKENNKDRAKDQELQKKYGISLVDHITMYKEQDGKCAICGIAEKDAPRGKLFVDHDHETGVVRGLLCHHCNSGLGHFMDNLDNLKRAHWYLEDFIDKEQEGET
jgi:hypothetical protein